MSARRVAAMAAFAIAGIAAGLAAVIVARRHPDLSLAGDAVWATVAQLAAGWGLIAAGLAHWARRPRSRCGPLLAIAGLAWFAVEAGNPEVGSSLLFTTGLVLVGACAPLIAHAVFSHGGVVTRGASAVLALRLHRGRRCPRPAERRAVRPGGPGLHRLPCESRPRRGQRRRLPNDDPRRGRAAGPLGRDRDRAAGKAARPRKRRGAPSERPGPRSRGDLSRARRCRRGAWRRARLHQQRSDRPRTLGCAGARPDRAVARGQMGARPQRAHARRSRAPGRRTGQAAAARSARRARPRTRRAAARARLPCDRRWLARRRRNRRHAPARRDAPRSRCGGRRRARRHRARRAEIARAARPALEHEHLQAERRAQLAELRASRARIVAAADGERRRLERDLHDGAQQRIVALALDLRLARRQITREHPELDAELGEAEDELRLAVAELRDIARGIHPPMLEDFGLAAALQALAEETPQLALGELPAGRFPEPVELAAYHLVAETLRGVPEGEVAVSARSTGTTLIVDVSPPDGPLTDAEDRIGALGGRLVRDDGGILRAELPCES